MMEWLAPHNKQQETGWNTQRTNGMTYTPKPLLDHLDAESTWQNATPSYDKTLKKLWIEGNCHSDNKIEVYIIFPLYAYFIYIGKVLYPCLYIIYNIIAIIIYNIVIYVILYTTAIWLHFISINTLYA